MFPSALPGGPRDVATTRGSRSRSAATTTARSASCRRCAASRSPGRSTRSSPRSSELAAAGVTEVTLLGQNVNSYGRDLQLAARRDGDARRHASGRCSPTCCAPPARSTASAGSASRRRTPRTCARRRSRRWPRRRPCARSCTTRCSPARDRVLAAMHRGYTAERYLDRLAEARRIVPDLAVSTDIIVGFPGETDDDFERTLEVAAEARFDDAFTFIFSPRPGTEAATMTDRFVDPAVAGERFDRLRVVIERSALAANRGARRPRRGGPRRGPEQEGPGRARRPHRASTGSSTSRRRARCAPASYADGRDHRRRAAPPHRVASSSVARRAGAPARASRSPPSDVTAAPVVVLGPTASGKSDVAMAAAGAVAGTEIVAVDAMQVYRGMDIGTAKPSPADRARGAAPLPRPRRPDASRSPSPTTARAYDARGRRRSPARPLLVAGTGLYLPRSSTASTCPASGPTVRAELERRADIERAVRAGWPSSTRSAAARIEPGNRRRIVRALEVVARQRPAVQLVRARPRTPTRRPTPCMIGLRWPRAGARRAHRAAGARR